MRSRMTEVVLLTLALAVGGCGGDGGATTFDGGADTGAEDAEPTGDAGGGDDAGGDGGPAGDASADAGGDAGSGDGCSLDRLFFSSADFVDGEGRLLVLDPGTGSVMKTDKANADTDSVVDRIGCTPLVLERCNSKIGVQSSSDPLTKSATIDVSGDYDGSDCFSPDNPNPWDVVGASPTKAYVVLYKKNQLLIIDPTRSGTEAIEDRIDLSPFAVEDDVDAVDAAEGLIVDGRLYVALGNLWGYPVSYGGSVIAVVDTGTDTLVDVDEGTDETDPIDLVGENPIAGLAYDEENDQLIVGSKGGHGEVDSGIEAIDLETYESTVILGEKKLAADIRSFEWMDATRGYVHLTPVEESGDGGMPTPGTPVVKAWDPSAGTVETEPLMEGASGMLLHEGVLYVWYQDSTDDRWKIRSFDSASGDETTPESGPYDMGTLPLYSAVASP